MSKRLELFLADADEHRPVLEQGLPREALSRVPRPKGPKDRDATPDKRRYDADPNDLPSQRWAVVAPLGAEGDRQLEAVLPLVRLREREQGAPARIYRVPPEMDARSAVAWKNHEVGSEDLPEEERPYYLLLLGDLHQTSLELQHVLAHGALVGRVHFADAAGQTDVPGYAAYAEKVVRHAGASASGAPDLLYYAADDGTSATASGRARLVEPGMAESERLLAKGSLPVASVDAPSARTVDQLLEVGARDRPAVLLTVSHGLGAPRRGWKSEEEQHRRQGAMVVGAEEILDAERMRGQRFLPGGMWFFLACFGAGTPVPGASAYHTWLSDLARVDAYGGDLDAVLRSLPRPEWRPFVAALPQAALASPEGPLAIVSHVDLAWSYAFSDTVDPSESRKSRILEPLHALSRGSRAGVALGKLMEPYREANDALTSMYQLQKDAQANGRPDPTDPKERGNLWMLRNDLRGYVLLGDPAARLPLATEAPRRTEPAPVEIRAAALEPAAGPLEAREAAVLETLRGDEAPRIIAERAGVPLSTLWEWVHAYRTAGRGQLG